MKNVGMLVVAVAVLFLCSSADGAIWYIHPDSALNFIQHGLDSCATNDTVLVGPGIYYENIMWPDMQGIDLISELGADTTIIECGVGGHIIILTNDLDSTTIIDGFTIRNGYDSGFYYGAILCNYNSSPVISNNVITENSYGAIACNHNSSPVISNNIITENSSHGIICMNNSSPLIISNTIAFNTTWGIWGAGIHCSNSSPIIQNNLIHWNDAGCDATVYGGGIYYEYSSPVISGNVISWNFVGNVSPGPAAGGGIACINSTGLISGNTITMNGALMGAGIYIADQGTPDPIIACNDIMNNYGYGLESQALYTIIQADSNWWGDATGPYHPTLNPGGLGDTVSDYVDFIPWLTSPGVEEQPIVKPVEKHENLTATIFRGPLQLPDGKKCKVFDITGRVVEPSKISRGVYFIEVDGVVTQKVVKVR